VGKENPKICTQVGPSQICRTKILDCFVLQESHSNDKILLAVLAKTETPRVVGGSAIQCCVRKIWSCCFVEGAETLGWTNRRYSCGWNQ